MESDPNQATDFKKKPSASRDNLSLADQLHGLILVDKPSGMTSHDVVARARRCLGIREIGHAGTLDPLATGLMILLLGEGTKLSHHILSADKSYLVKVRLGFTTDTLDRDGKVVDRFTLAGLTAERIQASVLRAQGDLELPVPSYSAVKIGGKKLYELARKSEISATPVRRMRYFNVGLREVGEDWFEASLDCEKGCYIRSWVDHIGRDLGCGGVVEELRRLASGAFRVESALPLAEIEERRTKFGSNLEEGQESVESVLGNAFVPLRHALPQWKALRVKGRDEYLMSNGQVSHDLSRRLIYEKKQAQKEGRTIPVKILSSETGQLLSLLEARPEGGLKVQRIFQIPSFRQ